MAFEPTSDYKNYDDIPYYRKRWFFVLCFLVFIPLMSVIALTGEVYAFQNGEVKKYPESFRYIVGIGWPIFIIFQIWLHLAR